MLDKVTCAIEKYGMIEPESRVIAAVSGGSDSMAMLIILNSLKDTMNFTLEAAHVNHCLRGESADRDEAYVKSTCEKLGIPFHLLRADVASIAKRDGKSLEEAGRAVRYEFFDSLGDDAVIATAHNLSDRVETFLFNFARGSALRGLCSIPPKRGNIIRPLINCSKSEIVEFCKENGIDFVTDETNSDVKYSRNRIRHNVITELKTVNGGFEENAARCIASLNEDEEFLSSLASELAGKANGDARMLADAPAPVRNRALIKIIERETGVSPDYASVIRVSEILNGGSCEINGGVRVRVRRGKLEFPAEAASADAPAEFQNGKAVCSGIEFFSEIINVTNNSQKKSGKILEYDLDCDKIVGKLTVRCREDGDKIKLYPSNCTKSLKKLFNEKAIPPEKRSSLPMAADDDGIILIPGIGFDRRVRVTDETKRILRIGIKMRKEDEND